MKGMKGQFGNEIIWKWGNGQEGRGFEYKMIENLYFIEKQPFRGRKWFWKR
jgi:hypothetical protein